MLEQMKLQETTCTKYDLTLESQSISEVVIVRWTQRDFWRDQAFAILFQEHLNLSFFQL